jgi:conjugal transfer pilus assembly protein TrbC
VRGRQLIMTMAILLAALFVINRIEDPVPVGGEEQLQDVQGLLERANQQERHMVVPRFHDNKAARETSNMYHSRKYQARLQKEIKWLKARVFPDVMTQAKNASTPKSTENAFLLPDERIYVFISSSIPVSTLRNYAADLDKLKDPHISMVMRGFVDGMHYIKPTIEFIEKILIKDPTCVSAYDPEPADVSSRQGERGSHTPKCDVYQATVNVDPLLYSRYGIQRVPAILYVRGVHSIDSGESEGITDNTSVSDAYLVSGDVSLEYALESIRKASKASQIQRILQELRRGFY